AGGLLEQFLDVREDQHAAVPGQGRVSADRRHHWRFAAAGGNHEAGIVIPLAQVLVHRVDGFFLIRTQRQHGADSIVTRARPSGTTSRLVMASETIWLSS